MIIEMIVYEIVGVVACVICEIITMAKYGVENFAKWADRPLEQTTIETCIGIIWWVIAWPTKLPFAVNWMVNSIKKISEEES